MQPNPNPNPKIIEDLKAAGEELKKSSLLEESRKSPGIQPSPLTRRSVAAELPKKTPFQQVPETTTRPPHPPTPPSARSGPLIDLPKKIEEYQKEISQEQSALERTYQQVKELEKRLGERIEFLKGLQTKSIEINKELKEFQEKLALAKKENSSLLDEVKNKLEKES